MEQIFSNVLAVLAPFSLACLILAVLPGPATALFLHRAIRDGRTAGLAAVVGNEIGLFMWALAAGTGITVLLRANRLLFETMHVIGGVVLIYLGISAWRNASKSQVGDEFASTFIKRLPAGRSPSAAFRASLVSIAANPKAAVFAFSFFPQFLPRNGHVFLTAVVLATIQIIIDGAYCAVVVLLAVRLRPVLSRDRIRRRLERVLGSVLIALGARLATETR